MADAESQFTMAFVALQTPCFQDFKGQVHAHRRTRVDMPEGSRTPGTVIAVPSRKPRVVNNRLNGGRLKCYNEVIMAAHTADTSDTAVQRPGAPQKQKADGSPETLVALTGDTYPLRAQLKAMGAVWDSAGRAWKIAPERAAQAQALVDHRPAVETAPSPAAAPPAAVPGRTEAAWNEAAAYETDPLAHLPDPFEESEPSIPPVALSGNTYPVKEALKALGAQWDKEQRAWLIAASKAAHAQAIVDNQQDEAPGEA
jgi:hypothetical protein